MFGSIKAFLSNMVGDASSRDRFAKQTHVIAITALLIRVATVRNELSPARRAKLHAMLQSRYGLDDIAAARLIVDAEALAGNAIDLYRFTRPLNEALDDEGRRRIVQMMWEIVYADRKVNEFEENIIWRAADLLSVSSRQRVELRQTIIAGMEALHPARRPHYSSVASSAVAGE